MTLVRRTLLLSLVALAGLQAAPSTASANDFITRQYYGSWEKHPTHNYFFRKYYYKPSLSYSGYKHHYVVYHPTQPNFVYYYNPYKGVYWGRCPLSHGGEPVYSLLAEEDRRPQIKQIPEKAFPKPAGLPIIPDATDKAKIDLPPDDVPVATQVSTQNVAGTPLVPNSVAGTTPTTPPVAPPPPTGTPGPATPAVPGNPGTPPGPPNPANPGNPGAPVAPTAPAPPPPPPAE